VHYGVTGGGNDGAVFSRYGFVDIPLGWPLRYSHFPAESSTRVISMRWQGSWALTSASGMHGSPSFAPHPSRRQRRAWINPPILTPTSEEMLASLRGQVSPNRWQVPWRVVLSSAQTKWQPVVEARLNGPRR